MAQNVKVMPLEQSILVFLIEKAIRQETTYYQEIAQAFSLPESGNVLGSTLSPILGRIFRYCNEKRLPRLTALVVRKSGADRGLPGNGFWELLELTHLDRDYRQTLTRVFQKEAYDYFNDLTQESGNVSYE